MAEVATQRYEAEVPIGRLKPHPKNTKQHDIDGIREAIRTRSFIGTIEVQESTGFVLAGHGTLEAAGLEGLETVPVLWVGLNDDDAEAYLLAANALQERAGYDEEALLGYLTARVEADGIEALVGTGYDVERYEDMLGKLGGKEVDLSEFTGGHVESPEEVAARTGSMTHGTQQQRGLRELVLVFTQEDFDEFNESVNEMRSEYKTDTTSATVLACIREVMSR